MHDLGKITITDLIVNKPDKLTVDEFVTMKGHANEGERIIDEMIAETEEGEYLLNAKLFAGYHHERWDGGGYPRGVKGEAIPLQGRLMAIADVYDALISEKPYKKASSHEEAVQLIMENSGKQYDPKIAEVFLAVNEQFKAVKENV
jgi:putative two-component system response regulator